MNRNSLAYNIRTISSRLRVIHRLPMIIILRCSVLRPSISILGTRASLVVKLILPIRLPLALVLITRGDMAKGGASHGSKGGITPRIEFQSRKKSGVNYLRMLDRLSSLRTSPNIRLTLVNKKTQARYPRHYGTNFLLMQERLLLLLTRAIGLVIKAVRQLLKIVHLSLKLP